MGYAYYEINTPEGKKMKRGYGVSCKCHKRGCTSRIDRGLSYLCYNCTQYFCSAHLTMAWNEDLDELIEVECFAGESSQVCDVCAKLLENETKEQINGVDPKRG